MVLSPYSLRTKDCLLESLYADHVTKAYLNFDRIWCLCKLSITSFFVASSLIGSIPTSTPGSASWLSYFVVLLLHNTLMRHRPNFYADNRDWLVLLLKFLLMGLLMSLVVTVTLQPIESIGSFVKVLFMGGGIVLMNCTGVCVPILWHQHAPLAAVVFLAYNAALLPSVVDTLMCTAASRLYVQQLYKSLHSAVCSASGMLLPTQGLTPPDAHPRAQAYVVVLWVQLVLGMLVPSVYLYCYEIRSRSTFLQQLGSNSSQQGTTAATPSGLQRNYEKLTSLYAALPPLPLMALLVSMLSVALWTVLHANSDFLARLFDELPTGVVGARIAAQHGASSCIHL